MQELGPPDIFNFIEKAIGQPMILRKLGFV
jgi:hypothetical protein